MEITQELLRDVFYYENGNLYWNISKPKVKKGNKAGHRRKDGYVQVRLNGKLYLVHRLVFLYHHGHLPPVLDHIDGNPTNNKIENIRKASTVENMRNRKINKNNTSTVKNVYFHKPSQKWQARLRVDGVNKSAGYYDTIEEAEKVIRQKRIEYYKEFARHE